MALLKYLSGGYHRQIPFRAAEEVLCSDPREPKLVSSGSEYLMVTYRCGKGYLEKPEYIPVASLDGFCKEKDTVQVYRDTKLVCAVGAFPKGRYIFW